MAWVGRGYHHRIAMFKNKGNRMKIAMFRNIECGFKTIDHKSLESLGDYIRLTEYVDVEFKSLDHGDVVAKEIAILRDVKKKIQAQTELKLQSVDQKIGDLLALPSAMAEGKP